METQVKNRDLPLMIYTLCGLDMNNRADTNESRYGLIYEPFSITANNRFQRIQRKLMDEWNEFHKAHIKLLFDFGAVEELGTGLIKLPEKMIAKKALDFNTQYEDLLNQANTIQFDAIDYAEIGKEKTIDPVTGIPRVYDYECLKAFFINYN